MDTESALGSCVDHVTQMYARTIEQLFTMNVGFDSVTPVGSRFSPGTGLQLSLSEVTAARHSILWALESWTGSGRLPDVDQLYSYVLSSGGSQVAIIFTLSLLAQGAGMLALLAGGHVDLVSREFDLLNQPEEPPSTLPNTSLKSHTRLVNGASLESRPKTPPISRRRSSGGSLAGSSTNSSSKPNKKGSKSGKKKKSSKSSTRKGKQQKRTRK